MIDNNDDLRKTQKHMARVARGTHALRMPGVLIPGVRIKGAYKDRNFPERY